MTQHRAEWIQALAGVVSSLAALVALWFLVTQIEYAKEQFLEYKAERKNEKMEALYQEWNSPATLYYRAKAAEGYWKDTVYITEVLAFFERLARSKQNGIITLDDLSYYFEDHLLYYWCDWEAWVRDNRAKRGEDPDSGELWRGFQTLVEEMKEHRNLKCHATSERDYFRGLERTRYPRLVPPGRGR